jgi:hypothetical protein
MLHLVVHAIFVFSLLEELRVLPREALRNAGFVDFFFYYFDP